MPLEMKQSILAVSSLSHPEEDSSTGKQERKAASPILARVAKVAKSQFQLKNFCKRFLNPRFATRLPSCLPTWLSPKSFKKRHDGTNLYYAIVELVIVAGAYCRPGGCSGDALILIMISLRDNNMITSRSAHLHYNGQSSSSLARVT